MWLLEQEVAEQLRALRAAGIDCSEAQRADFAERCVAETARHGGTPRNLNVAGDVAEITVEGILTETPDFFAWLFGGGNTTYASIRQAVALADADPGVKKVVFKINSPGGEVNGLFDTLGAIEASKKPSSVTASFAASAAYAIAATGGKITATNAAVQFGSIGVAVSFFHMEEVIDITSTEAPNKRPDPSTPEGKAVIIEHLDALHAIFADAIARGRGTTVSNVNKTFGRGGILLSAEARRRGMIDRVAKTGIAAVVVPPPSSSEIDEDMSARGGQQANAHATPEPVASVGDVVAVSVPDLALVTDPPTPTDDAPATGVAPTATAASAAPNEKRKPMNLEELKAQHPELCAVIREEAVATERDRVGAHLTCGEGSGDMTTAIAAIKDGSEMTQTLMAKYSMAGRNRTDIETQQTDSAAAGEAVDGAATTTGEGPDLGDNIVAILDGKNGVSANA